ncbi:hypothetical protein ACWY4P_11950 [Streptomyces sp. LZ34]
MRYRGLILDFGGVLTTQMRLNGEAFEKSEGLEPGAYFVALGRNPEGVRVYADLEVGRATQEDWNRVIGKILGVDRLGRDDPFRTGAGQEAVPHHLPAVPGRAGADRPRVHFRR